jgi:hypothetical protein
MPSPTIYETWYVPRIGKGNKVLQRKMNPQEENSGKTELNALEQQYF